MELKSFSSNRFARPKKWSSDSMETGRRAGQAPPRYRWAWGGTSWAVLVPQRGWTQVAAYFLTQSHRLSASGSRSVIATGKLPGTSEDACRKLKSWKLSRNCYLATTWFPVPVSKTQPLLMIFCPGRLSRIAQIRTGRCSQQTAPKFQAKPQELKLFSK